MWHSSGQQDVSGSWLYCFQTWPYTPWVLVYPLSVPSTATAVSSFLRWQHPNIKGSHIPKSLHGGLLPRRAAYLRYSMIWCICLSLKWGVPPQVTYLLPRDTTCSQSFNCSCIVKSFSPVSVVLTHFLSYNPYWTHPCDRLWWLILCINFMRS